MTRINRNVVACGAAAFLTLAIAVFVRAAESTEGGNPGQAQLQQAADAVAAGAKDSVAAARNDSEAIKRAQLSLYIIRNIGDLGGFNTTPQADKLMDELRATSKPAVVEALVQIQFGSKLNTWMQLGDAERAAALEHFAADVKKTGLTKAYADLLLQLANRYGEFDEKGIANTINEVLPTVKNPNDPLMKKIKENLAGIARRLGLVGKPMEMEGSLLDGSKLDWADYKGKVVLVDFSASWCGPCRAEAPNVLRNYRAYHDKGFEVLTISLDIDPSKAEQSIKESGCDFPTLFSEDSSTRGWDHPMVTKYGVNGIPTAILVGKDGKVLSTKARGDVLNELLASQFGPPAEGAESPNADADKSSSIENDREVVQAADVETN